MMLCLFLNNISIFVKWYAEFDFVSLYSKSIKSYLITVYYFLLTKFLFHLVYILLYVCCASFIVINMTISISL